jgi:hypothetical protein
MGKKKKTNEEFINELKLINDKIIPLEKYKSTHCKILCKCKICGTEWMVTPHNLLCSKSGCPKCNSLQKTSDKFIEQANIKNPKVEVIGEYKNARTKITVRCKDCGFIWNALPVNILRNKSKKTHGCPNCALKNISGKNNYNYKYFISDEERNKRRIKSNERHFVKKCMERDNYTCQLSGQKGCKLCVHHIDGFNWCKSKRSDINNGITLSEKIHKKFHSIYGNGNNTKEQFIEFVNTLHKSNEITEKRYKNILSKIK